MDQLKKKHLFRIVCFPLRLKKKKPPPQQQQQQRKENKPSIGGFLYKHVLRWDDVLWSDADEAYKLLRSVFSTLFLIVEKGIISSVFLDIKSIEKHEST